MFETMWTVKRQSLTCVLVLCKSSNILDQCYYDSGGDIMYGCTLRIMYLGLNPEGVIGKEDLFKILIIAGKKAITRNWLKPDPPGLG